MDRVREFRDARRLGLPPLVLGLLAVTGLASRQPLSARGKLGATTGGFQIAASPWQFALIAGGGLIAFVFVLVYGGFSRRTPVAGSLPSLLVRLAVLFLPVLITVLVAHGVAALHRHGAPLRIPSSGGVASPRPARAHASEFTVPVWITWAMLAALAGATLLLMMASKARAHRDEQPPLPSAVGSAITGALVDLETVADPRLAIIAAYRRMELSLAEVGFARASPEAPREYMARVASALDVDPAPFGTLTILFEAARFSRRQLDATARQRAMTALRSLQGQLA